MNRNSVCFTAFLLLLLATPSPAQVFQPGLTIELRDEGVSVGRVRALDCVGSGIGCTFAGTVGTITITGGGGGAPTDALYWVGAAHAGLSAELDLSGFTGLVLNTAGTPSAYAGASCTNQVLTALSASGAGTCTTLTSAYTSGTFPASAHNLLSATHGDTAAASVVRGDILRGNSTPAWSRLALGGNNLYLKSNATDLVYSTLAAGGVGSCTNQTVTALNADAAPTCSTITSTFVDASIVPSTRTISTTAPLSGGGDLSTNRTLTTSMATARLIGRTTAATGPMEEISVTAPLTLNALALGFDQTAALGNNARVTVRKNTGADVGGRRRLNLIEGTNVTLTIADDAGGEEVDITIAAAGGAGANWTTYELDFGSAAKFVDVETVTDAAVSASSKIMVLQSGLAATGRQADENEMDELTCRGIPASGQFSLLCSCARSVTHGKFKVAYTVN